jgi:2-hydroxycyclohexanecarboxyl-CoA dehydrogenase
MSNLFKKNVLVTGAGGGIGSAIADAFQKAGWQVLGIDLTFAKKQSSLNQQFECDISQKDPFSALLKRICNDYQIDALVNCAGITRLSAFLDLPTASWQPLIDVNFVAPMLACSEVLPGMIKRGGGAIISITSDSSRTGAAGESVYAGSKAAVVAFSKSLAQEVGKHNITVNCISPGVVETPMSAPNQELLKKFAKRVPLKRLGQPEDIAGAVVFLASEQANYITGQVLSVGGGLTMVD